MMCFKNLFGKKETVEEKPDEPVNEANEPQTQNENPGPVTPITPAKKPYEDKNFVILLDNGHARSTPGKRSPKFPDGSQLFEYEFNRAVVARMAKKLDDLGIKYHVLVPEVEEDIALTTRANRANEYCKKYGTSNCLFISVHANAFGDGVTFNDANGWCIYTTKGVTKSDAYAKVFYDVAQETLPDYGFRCRNGRSSSEGNEGPDYESNFTVIYKAWCPAVLTENLFFTNLKECEFLRSDKGREVIANIHAEAIKRIIDSL